MKRNIENSTEQRGKSVIQKITTIQKPKPKLFRKGEELNQEDIASEFEGKNTDKAVENGNIHKVIPKVIIKIGEEGFIPQKKKKYNPNKKFKV